MSDVVSNEMFRCTWCCDVGADVTCSGVVRCQFVRWCWRARWYPWCALGSDVFVDVLG